MTRRLQILSLLLVPALLGAAEQGKTNPIRPNPADLPPPADPAAITAPPGFKVEMLYSVPRADQGSWVSLTTDPKGRILASDQYGGIYRITPPPLGTTAGIKVEKLDLDLNRVSVPAPAPEEPRKGKNEKAKEKSGPVERLEVGVGADPRAGGKDARTWHAVDLDEVGEIEDSRGDLRIADGGDPHREVGEAVGGLGL